MGFGLVTNVITGSATATAEHQREARTAEIRRFRNSTIYGYSFGVVAGLAAFGGGFVINTDGGGLRPS